MVEEGSARGNTKPAGSGSEHPQTCIVDQVTEFFEIPCMFFTSTLTSKNQTTIPKAVVAALHARPSATLCFEVEPDGRILLSAKTATFAELAPTFPKRRRKTPATLEEMQQAIRDGASQGYKRRASKTK
jgi:bifunctional DNA-binding transcriptional regulator/antitoxin component of YhaV-PrlF toxin-antitoxin module